MVWMLMTRFKIAYNLDKNLKPEDINIKQAKQVKIIDLREELPGLIVADEEAAREWIKYWDNTDKESSIDEYIKGIKKDFTYYVNLNKELIEPKGKEYFDEDSEEYVSILGLRDKLFYNGYLEMCRKTEANINGKLSALKNLILEHKR